MTTNPKVDFYFHKSNPWQAAAQKLRNIMLPFAFEETLKWGVPCYTFEGGNTIIIHSFKEYCALLFFKGALLKDAENLLIQQSENVQAARQMRFTSLEEIAKLEKHIQTYVQEAIEIQKSGVKVVLKKPADLEMPTELLEFFEADAAFEKAFKALTPGRQRAYVLHFEAAKQLKTKIARIEKYLPHIMAGKGMLD